MKEIFQRAELLLGTEAMVRLSEKRVILFGVGGVGSWCAEALVRTGLKHLTIVDFDCVDVTNVNRQLMATTKTVGQVKVEALKERLLAINPDAESQHYSRRLRKHRQRRSSWIAMTISSMPSIL